MSGEIKAVEVPDQFYNGAAVDNINGFGEQSKEGGHTPHKFNTLAAAYKVVATADSDGDHFVTGDELKSAYGDEAEDAYADLQRGLTSYKEKFGAATFRTASSTDEPETYRDLLESVAAGEIPARLGNVSSVMIDKVTQKRPAVTILADGVGSGEIGIYSSIAERMLDVARLKDRETAPEDVEAIVKKLAGDERVIFNEYGYGLNDISAYAKDSSKRTRVGQGDPRRVALARELGEEREKKRLNPGSF